MDEADALSNDLVSCSSQHVLDTRDGGRKEQQPWTQRLMESSPGSHSIPIAKSAIGDLKVAFLQAISFGPASSVLTLKVALLTLKVPPCPVTRLLQAHC